MTISTNSSKYVGNPFDREELAASEGVDDQEDLEKAPFITNEGKVSKSQDSEKESRKY